MEYETCIWCGLRTEKSDGPVHRYLESSPGCWAKFGALLVREYENVEYKAVHELTVDTYALQHPGKKSRQTINSANVHLVGLYSYFELGTPIHKLPDVKREIVKYKDRFVWLDPPDDMKAITVADVLKSETADEHWAKVKEWAEYIFEKWNLHHSAIANIIAISR